MLTLDAQWIAAFTGKAAVDVAFLVRVDMDATHSATWCLANRPVLGHPASVLAVEDVCAALDPVTRRVSIETATVRFADDATVRDVVAAGPWRLRGKKLTILVGTPSLAEVDFEEAFVGIIQGSPVVVDGAVSVSAGDSREPLRQRKVTLALAGDHPLEVIRKLLLEVSTPLALYDFAGATDLNPEAAGYLTSISHYNVDRRNTDLKTAAVSEPTPAIALVEELCESMHAAFLPRENGVLEFKRWDSTAAVVATWGSSELLRVSHEETDRNLVNRITVEMVARGPGYMDLPYVGDVARPGGTRECSTMREDTDAQAAIAYPGAAVQVVDVVHNDAWVNADGRLAGDINGAVLALNVWDSVAGFCGLTDVNYYTGALAPANRRASATRLVYLLVDDEIIECDAVVPSTAIGEWLGAFYGYDVGPDPPGDAFPNSATFTVTATGRGARGTGAVPHVDGAPVRDITIAVNRIDALLQRFRLGAPVIKVETALDQFAVQLADFVTIETGEFLSPTVSLAVGNTEKWEVVGKEPMWMDGRIVWTLCHVPQAAIGVSGWKTAQVPGTDHQDEDEERGNNEAVWNRCTTSGAVIAAGAGLTVTMTAGVFTGASTVEHAAATLTLKASRDSYIGYSKHSHSLIVQDVAAGGAIPSIMPTEVRLARVITGAAAITSVLDLRRTKPLRDADCAAYTLMGDSEPSRGLAVNSDFGHQSLGRGSPPDNVEMVTGTWLTDADIDTTTVLEGVQSLCLKNTAVATQLQSAKCIGVQLPRTVGGNTLTQAYEMTAHVRADSVAAGDVITLGVKWYTAADPRVLISTSTIHNAAVLTAANTWEHKHGVVEAPATARYAKLYVLKAANAFNVYLDSWALRRAQYGFHAYEHDTAQALVNKAFTQITFDTEEYDHGGGFQLGTSTYRAYHTGVHTFNAVVCFTPSEVGALSWADLILYRNGAYAKALDRRHPVSLAVGVVLAGGTQLYLTEGDLVTLYVYLDNATGNADTIPGQRYVWFAGCEGYGGY